MFKKIKVLVMLVALLAFGGVAFASVAVIDDGTYKGEATSIRVNGSTDTWDGSTYVIDVKTPATVTTTSVNVGTATVGGVLGTNYVAVKDGLEVDGSVYFDGVVEANGVINANSNAFVDGSIYMTTASPAAGAGVGLWISQPDGGCSKCYVDAAGTTWACADATCPTGM